VRAPSTPTLEAGPLRAGGLEGLPLLELLGVEDRGEIALQALEGGPHLVAQALPFDGQLADAQRVLGVDRVAQRLAVGARRFPQRLRRVAVRLVRGPPLRLLRLAETEELEQALAARTAAFDPRLAALTPGRRTAAGRSPPTPTPSHR
jgi:hypothetical protein